MKKSTGLQRKARKELQNKIAKAQGFKDHQDAVKAGTRCKPLEKFLNKNILGI